MEKIPVMSYPADYAKYGSGRRLHVNIIAVLRRSGSDASGKQVYKCVVFSMMAI